MKPLIAGNWKMNPKTLFEARRLFNAIKKGVKNLTNGKVVVCPPFIYLATLNPAPRALNPRLGAQDCFWEEKGAFTGEVSPSALKNLGAEYVILGHSERRKYQKETNAIIKKKIKAALGAGLKPILCIDKVSQIPKGKSKKLILAYEPISAIGTGRPYSIEKAKEIRRKIKHPFVLYGGSVNAQNSLDYIKKAGFQGLLVGGSSLNPEEFVKIVKRL